MPLVRLALPTLLLVAGCSASRSAEPAAAPGASAILTSADGVEGAVTFVRTDGAVRVRADIRGLTPGEHGFHIHETGDCSADDFSSAGPHFNPHGHDHGAPTDARAHAGDLGNLEAAADGSASIDLQRDLVLAPGADGSIIGRAVIVHALPDDLKTQPSGAAGRRIACGVIGPDV